jgi:hypothetical protein
VHHKKLFKNMMGALEGVIHQQILVLNINFLEPPQKI